MPDLHVFCCYAYEDTQLFDNLDAHLTTLKRTNQLILHSNHTNLPGKDRDREMQVQLDMSEIILVLMSPDLLRSDDFASIERYCLPQAREEHLIIPILLRPMDWKNTQFGMLQVLPKNQIPTTLWKNQDEALLEVANHVRWFIEQGTQKNFKTVLAEHEGTNNRHNRRAVPQIKGPGETVSTLEDYIYISDAKLDLLEKRIGAKKDDVASAASRYHMLHALLTTLRKKKRIKNVDSGIAFKYGDYIFGACPIRWGIVDWGTKFSFFFSRNNAQTPHALLMAGSVHHLLQYRQPQQQSLQDSSFGLTSSAMPNIMSAIEFAAENSNVRWSEAIGNIADYLFALGFAQGKFIHQLKVKQLASPFPEQEVEFVALVLKQLVPPSAQELHAFFSTRMISKEDKQEIKQMLYNAPNVLICSPLYVASSNGR